MLVSKTNIKFFRIALKSYVFIFPFLLFIALEGLNATSSAGLFANIRQSMPSLLFSVFLLVCMAAVVYSVSGSLRISYGIVSLIGLITYIINYLKFMVTGGVFVPTDILLTGAAFQMLETGALNITFSLILPIIIVILLNIPLYFVTLKIKFPKRIIALPVIIAVFAVFFTGNFVINNIFPVFGLERGTVTDRYRDHGLILGFYFETVQHNARPAADFTAMGMLQTHYNIPEEPTENVLNTETETIIPVEPIIPNVIVVMSEAFTDPTAWGNIEFSQYPVSNFRRLSLENLSGRAIVPVHGGGTSNTEFEFLGGSPHVFFGSRFYVPFENTGRYFFREIPAAMPWMFQQNGYRTIGIHPHNGDFFNRRQIYPLIGFDEFIAQEEMPNAQRRGQFISDEYFTDRIIEQILIAEDDDTPLFLFGISMQNHWGFEPEKYGSMQLDVTATSPQLNSDEISRVNSYLQGIFDADKQLGRLVEFIEERETPTILVFFGDHQPILGRHSDRILNNLGYISAHEDFNWTIQDRERMFGAPYLVWANYDINQEGGDWGTLSVYMLGALVAEASGIDLNLYFTHLLDTRQHFRALTNELYVDIEGNFHHGWELRNQSAVQTLEALWRINIFGEEDDFWHSLSRLQGR